MQYQFGKVIKLKDIQPGRLYVIDQHTVALGIKPPQGMKDSHTRRFAAEFHHANGAVEACIWAAYDAGSSVPVCIDLGEDWTLVASPLAWLPARFANESAVNVAGNLLIGEEKNTLVFKFDNGSLVPLDLDSLEYGKSSRHGFDGIDFYCPRWQIVLGSSDKAEPLLAFG